MSHAKITQSSSSDHVSILVVDDSDMNRELLLRRLNRVGYHVELACNGFDALELLLNKTIDLVLLDIIMPVMDGYQVLNHMKSDARLKHIPVVVITAVDDLNSAVECINSGAEDYLLKPFDSTILNARINSCLEKKQWYDLEIDLRNQIQHKNQQLEQRVEEQIEAISQAQLSTIFGMSKLAESRDPETGEHLERLRDYCRIVAEHLRQSSIHMNVINSGYIESLCAASPLHDIGKVGVPDSILLKPGSLTEMEWEVMRKHPTIGANTLREVNKNQIDNEFIRIGIEIAEFHHEHWNGNGYPHGIAGEDIPLAARILSLGDVYDALRSKRPYKESFSHAKCCKLIAEGRGQHFDPDVVDAFLAKKNEFNRIWQFYKDSD